MKSFPSIHEKAIFTKSMMIREVWEYRYNNKKQIIININSYNIFLMVLLTYS
jgi:hypothetical protein